MSAAGSNLVAIDSNVLVWGVRKQGTKEQLDHARWLFEKLDAEEAQVIVPAVVVAEYLTPLDPGDHAAVIAAISHRFIIAPFDVRAASVAAVLFKKGQHSRPKGQPGGRACLRADSLIIATALVHGAKILYSGDAGCRGLAKGERIEARDLPDQPNDLFDQH